MTTPCPGPMAMPVRTQLPRVPRLWLFLMNYTWFAGLYTLFVITTTLPFTLRHFTDDTRLISLVTSIGLWFGIVLGPLVNYISDRIWTRFGRRRPFMLVAVCGTLLAMFSIPFVPGLAPLIMVVVISSILGDVGSTQEPLWLEVIPPAQRGQAFAIRMFSTNLACLLFFQVMFAQFDHRYHLGAITLTGEQICYLSAGVFQLIYFILLAFCIREERPPGTDLRHPGEVRPEQIISFVRGVFSERRWWHYVVLCPLPAPWMLRLAEATRRPWLNLLVFPGAFMAKFTRDVFGEKRWWWVYGFFISSVLLSIGGNFSNLMLAEQFKYSKPDIALTGLPVMLINNLCLIPFAGWFADRLPRFKPLLLLAVAAGASVAQWYFLRYWLDLPPLTLPPFWAMMVIASLNLLAVGSLALWLFQLTRGFKPGINPRVWAWGLFNLGSVLVVVLTYFGVKNSAQGVPAITLWFFFLSLGSGLMCLQIVSGPLLYDLLPKDKIGTLSSGNGLLSTAVNASATTLVGSWIYYFTYWTTGSTATKDYSSYLVLQMIFGAVTIGLTALFFWRFVRGRVVEYGRLGLNSDQTPGTTLPHPPSKQPKPNPPDSSPLPVVEPV